MIINQGVTLGKGIQVGESAIAHPLYSASTNKFSFLQGDVLTVTLDTSNVLDGTIFYWNVEGLILPGYLNVQSGVMTVKNKQATANITFINDLRSLMNPGMPNAFYISIKNESGMVVASTQKCIVAAAGIAASGGVVTTTGNYKYHVYSTSGTFTPSYVPDGSTIEIITIAGGGGGGASAGGGGGAGGVVINTTVNVITNVYTVTVGAGGATGGSGGSPGAPGTVSSFVLAATNTSIVALGGGGGGTGGGGTSTALSAAGGSGGGGSSSLSVGGCPGGDATQPTSASGGYGNPGGSGIDGVPNTRPCGGGGGAGGAGGGAGYYYGGNGGSGITHSILDGAGVGQLSNGARYVAGGGFGSSTGTWTPGAAGIGKSSYGGGGNSATNANGGAVIIRYRI